MLNFEDIQELANGVRIRGGRAFLVGGWVRDQLMGLESKDFDVEIHNLSAKGLVQELEIFAKFKKEKLNLVGKSFGVFKVGLNLDVSLPRTDQKTGDGHKGFEISSNPELGTLESSRRRDFTCNSMLLDPLNGELIDHFGGREDIKNKVIRMVNPSAFTEDPLRILRAIQFLSRFS